MLWKIIDKVSRTISNITLENESETPFLLANIVDKNFKLLALLCGLVEDGSFVFTWCDGLLTLRTPLNTFHTYEVGSDLKLTLVSQETMPLTLAELKANTCTNR